VSFSFLIPQTLGDTYIPFALFVWKEDKNWMLDGENTRETSVAEIC